MAQASQPAWEGVCQFVRASIRRSSVPFFVPLIPAPMEDALSERPATHPKLRYDPILTSIQGSNSRMISLTGSSRRERGEIPGLGTAPGIWGDTCEGC